MNTDALVEVLLRWGHVISGIAWIGLLYFFNLVNVPFQGRLDAETKKKVNPELLLRALWWFRWAAMSTLVFGLLLFVWMYMSPFQNLYQGEGPDRVLSARALNIMIGMTLAIIMWFNVWFVIWPAQRLIISGLMSGNPAPPALGKRALFASRFNAYSSGPMLFFMFLAPHYSTMDVPVLAIGVVIGLLAVHLAIKASSKVGTVP
jgi:uncharacterized membrane protein